MIDSTILLVISHSVLIIWALYERYCRMNWFGRYRNLSTYTNKETFHEHAVDWFNIEVEDNE